MRLEIQPEKPIKPCQDQVKPDMEEPFEDVRKLLRLKRYEQPGDDFFERFVHEFGQRQRAELLRHSSRRVLLDRLGTIWWENGFGRWAYGAVGATCVAAIALAGWQWQRAPGDATAEAQAAPDDPSHHQATAADPATYATTTRASDAAPQQTDQDAGDAGLPAATTPAAVAGDVRLTNFIAVPDPIEFSADVTLDFEVGSAPGFLPSVPPGVDPQARHLFESTRLRAASSDGGGSYIPLSEQ